MHYSFIFCIVYLLTHGIVVSISVRSSFFLNFFCLQHCRLVYFITTNVSFFSQQANSPIKICTINSHMSYIMLWQEKERTSTCWVYQIPREMLIVGHKYKTTTSNKKQFQHNSELITGRNMQNSQKMLPHIIISFNHTNFSFINWISMQLVHILVILVIYFNTSCK